MTKVRLGDMTNEDKKTYKFYKEYLSLLNIYGSYLLEEEAHKTINKIEEKYARGVDS